MADGLPVIAPPLTHLPTCDVFLAPSTIPGSACIDTKTKKKKQNQHYFTCCVCGLLLFKCSNLEVLGRIGDIDLQLYI